MLSFSVWYWPQVQYRRSVLGEPFVRALVPTTYMIWALPYTDQGEWISLYHRVSGNPPTGGLFGDPSSTTLPASISPILDLSPDPTHIGYSEIDPDNTYDPNLIFNTGIYVPQQRVWRWQGRYLLDRLWAIADDEKHGMPDRLGAFYLYTGYCGYTRLKHVDRALPLLLGEHGAAFLEASDERPYWGPKSLDPALAVEQLTALLLGGSDDLVEGLNIIDALALTGNPALDAIAKCWESNDPALHQRGALLLQELCSTARDTIRKGITDYRNRLDAEKFVALIKWAETDGKEAFGNNAYNALADLVDLSPRFISNTGADSEEEYEYQFIEPDEFFISFTTYFLDWVIEDYINKRLAVDEEAPVLESYWMFGMNYVPRGHALWRDVLDQTDRLLLETDNESLHWMALSFYDPLYNTDDRSIPGKLSDADKARLRGRLRDIMQRSDVDYVKDQIEFLISEFEASQLESTETRP
jgi:hypothetical protein